MDRMFQVDEIPDQLWSPHSPIRLSLEEEEAEDYPSSSAITTAAASKMMRMNRSSSEWAFQRFLQETAEPDRTTTTLQSPSSSMHPHQNDEVVEIKGNHHYSLVGANSNQQQPEAAPGPPPDIPIDSKEYQTYLKSRLQLACAAVALTWGTQLKVENSSLLKRLTDITHKYNEAAVDNRVLKADVETLRAKVKMAEETVKRVTGLNPLFQAMSEISTMGMASFVNSPDTSADAAVPVRDDLKQDYHHTPSNSRTSMGNHTIQTGTMDIAPGENVQSNATAAVGSNEMGRTVSMQRVASLEHLQKRIRVSSGTQGAGEP
ncbi:UNVERIFIED_CONTAM: Light-inducible protein CP [Sesamum latifolium]|uniref:Light-inducible protein CP n=1 Tax=Sesamum latifolium TaxID=2727402 RepID=A0AAW2YEH6_9LAMI